MKLGMLGMWHTHADGIVRRVAENPKEFTLVGFYDPDPQVVAKRRQEWTPRIEGFRVFDSPDKLLAEKLDGVVVEGRVYENVALAKLALESGRPLMLEKPAGDRLDDFRKLVDLAQRKHLHVQMIYLFRYMSAVQEMLRRAKAGDYGDIYMFRGRLPKDLPSYDRYGDELGRYKGGMFFEMAGHLVDMMVAMLGPPKSVAPFLAHHHKKPGDFIDNGVAVFGFERAWAVIEVPSLEVVPYTRRIEVYGTSGAAIIPHLGSGHLANQYIQPIETCKAGATRWETHELPAATLQIADLREFSAVVGQRKKPDFTLEHDLAVQEALLRASNML
jgi:predicted dehydrogenase